MKSKIKFLEELKLKLVLKVRSKILSFRNHSISSILPLCFGFQMISKQSSFLKLKSLRRSFILANGRIINRTDMEFGSIRTHFYMRVTQNKAKGLDIQETLEMIGYMTGCTKMINEKDTHN